MCVSLCVVGYRGLSAESETATLREENVGHRTGEQEAGGGSLEGRCRGEKTVAFKTPDDALPLNSERRGLENKKCVPVIEEIELLIDMNKSRVGLRIRN